MLSKSLRVRTRMTIQFVRPLTSGMPDFKPRAVGVLWSAIRALSRIGVINDSDTLEVIRGSVNGVNVKHAPLHVELTIDSVELYDEITSKLEGENISFHPELVIKIRRAE